MGRGFGEGFDFLTAVVDGADRREGAEIDLVALGVVDLRHQADVGERGFVAAAEIARRVLDRRFEGLKPSAIQRWYQIMRFS